MNNLVKALALATLLVAANRLAARTASPAVVINEIFFHAPDDLDTLQFIELHNPGAASVDLSGWKLTRGVQYVFPAGTRLESNSFLVFCKDRKIFKKHYGSEASGEFTGTLSDNGESVELSDSVGKKIDGVKYGTRAPWPLAPDGYGSSLERICPTAPATGPENWAPSPVAGWPPKPGGTPGKKNANFVTSLPPLVSNVTIQPAHAAPDQEVTIEADVADGAGLRLVEVRYRVAGSNFEKPELAVPMTKATNGRYAARIPGQKAGQIIRCRVHVVGANGVERYVPNEKDVRPALSCYVHDEFRPGKVPFGLVINVGTAEFRAGQGEGGGFGPPLPTPSPRGKSAFVYVDQKTGTPELFDYVNVTPRRGGRKVRFHRDHVLNGMTTINVIHEYHDRFVLAEPLAYEVYRRSGNAACRTDFLRTWIDGRPVGFQLLVEQPNKSFLRHNKLDTDGNLYKCVWYGGGVVGQHEKHSNLHEGHDDVVKLVGQLNRTKGDQQWEVIKKSFDVEQVINYFAVNMLLSHWDGYFNNYFTYHDAKGTGKWTMYPWDQDKTWGFHDGIQGYEVFSDMPVTFGMNGDAPLGGVWWRPAGHFSGPLLANARFRKLFLARTKELLNQVYTEEVFFPLIAQLRERLGEEVRIRAQAQGGDPKQATEHFERNLDSLRQHLVKRRKFLLAQPAIKTAGAFDRSELK